MVEELFTVLSLVHRSVICSSHSSPWVRGTHAIGVYLNLCGKVIFDLLRLYLVKMYTFVMEIYM